MDAATSDTRPDAELAELRARLAAIEAALGNPGRWQAPAIGAPPTLPALARRVAALEQGGYLPAPAAVAPVPAPVYPSPTGTRTLWHAAAQAALTVALLLAVAVWLLRPAGGQTPGTPPAGPPPATASAPPAPRAVPAAPPVPVSGSVPGSSADAGTGAGGASCRLSGDDLPADCTWGRPPGGAPPWPAAAGDPDSGPGGVCARALPPARCP